MTSILLMKNVAIMPGIGIYLLIVILAIAKMTSILLMKNVAIMPRYWSIFTDSDCSNYENDQYFIDEILWNFIKFHNI
jgi:hypothetical protein